MRGFPGSGFIESELRNSLEESRRQVSGEEHADAQEEDGEGDEFGGRERSWRIEISLKLRDPLVVDKCAKDKHTEDHGNGLMRAHG
jgi:hypothetical protein